MGFTNHGVTYAASDILLTSRFEHNQHANVHECFKDSMRVLFELNGSAEPDLSSNAIW